ncbi:retinol dehydrogenase 11-like isoform X2 [Leguminivora glycinivorella]|uniref:retinol dehydrogenase 11-like isoform X2 n=1 Tax=Leguminivora glycinivorella TaxID=1035111 RepID=UPI00200E9046|nr:retinol dehydrogenase 11-like isoform X2 [Leguminivora glycinivorella]
MDYLSGWCKSGRRLEGMTAIVTGSNTGIGRETALDLYLRGCRVIMACRDTNKANVAKSEIETLHESTEGKGSLIVRKLDTSSLNSVREFASLVLAEEGKVEILVNNAGVMMAPRGISEDGFEMHMATNHFGHALLTLLLLPKLASCTHARVVFVSSIVHERAELDFGDMNYETTKYDPLTAYCRSKVANVLFARALSQKLRDYNIANVSTYSLHPGVISTEIGRHFSDTYFPGTTWIFDNILSWFSKSPRCGAQTSIYCALDEKCADQSGLYYSDCAVKASSKYSQNYANAEELWNVTLTSLKISQDTLFSDLATDVTHL